MIPKFEAELSAAQLERLVTAEERKVQALVDIAGALIQVVSEARTFMAFTTEILEEERKR